MASTSIGTAWIQIKPSLSGISKDIEKAIGDPAEKSSESAAKNFGAKFLSSAKSSFSEAFAEFGKRSDAAWAGFKNSAKVAITSAGALIGGAMTYAVKQYADYEQLVGGVDTLFKNNSGAVQAYAKDAYKTAQISANQYMETITGFSASLLQSLGGDTAKAAKIGNMAVIDMADNANKMGTSMESIQYAYQGFAKQNYTMLDNLKLGYGGTKEEMQRLLTDATKLTGVKYDIKNLDEVYSAIHAIQENLGITGTSAEEASSTISGSFATAKAAFDDMMVSLADPYGDFSGQLDKFLSAAKQFLQNLAPVIANIGATVFDEIKKQSPELAKTLEDIGNGIATVFDFVKNNQELVLTILKFVAGFKALQVATGGVRSVMSTLSPYGKLLKGTFELAAGGAQTLIGKFKGFSKAGDAAKSVDGLKNSSVNLEKSTPKTFTFGESIANFLKNIGQILGGAVDAIMEPIKRLMTGIGEAIAGFLGAFSNPQILIGSAIFVVAAAAIAAAIVLISGAIGIATPSLQAFLNQVVIPLGTFIAGVFVLALFALTSSMIALTQQAVIPLIQVFSGGLTNAINAVSGLFGSIGGVVSGVVRSIGTAISDIINSIANLLSSAGNANWYGTGYGITRNFSAGLIDGLIDLSQDVLNKVINSMLSVPVIGDGLKMIGLKNNPINLSGFKLGRRAEGGAVFGAGTATSDSIPMALSNGEYVLRTAAAKSIGYDNLDKINKTGSLGGGGMAQYITFNIDGGNKDPRTIANEVSRIIAIEKGRVYA